MKGIFNLFKCCQPKKDEDEEGGKNVNKAIHKDSHTSRSKDILSDYKIDVDIDENIRKSNI